MIRARSRAVPAGPPAGGGDEISKLLGKVLHHLSFVRFSGGSLFLLRDQGDRAGRRTGRADSFSGRLTKANSLTPVAARSPRSRFSKIRIPSPASRIVWLGRCGRVPGQHSPASPTTCCQRRPRRPAARPPTPRAAGHPAAGDVVRVVPGGAPSGVHQQDVAGAHRRLPEPMRPRWLVPLDQVLGWQPVPRASTRSMSTPRRIIGGSDSADRIPPPGPWLAAGTATPPNMYMSSAWWRARDMRARVVGGQDHPGRAGPALQARLMPPVQHERVVGGVRREHRHPGEPRLLKIDHAGLASCSIRLTVVTAGRGHRDRPRRTPQRGRRSPRSRCRPRPPPSPRPHRRPRLDAEPICSGLQPLRSAPERAAATS